MSVDKLNQAMTDGQIRSIFQPQGQGIEGFLFPDTYDIGEGADERTVVQTMVAPVRQGGDRSRSAGCAGRVGRSPYEALIVASLVEEEAKVDEDRAKIARVIYNRLAQGIPLGVDATLCYLKDEPPCVLRESDLAQASPYNTRSNPGLPPTPIADVSRASLEAALNPRRATSSTTCSIRTFRPAITSSLRALRSSRRPRPAAGTRASAAAEVRHRT